ncbi:MAG: RNA polymerase sigma factor [Candidatus Eisenbacteria bacterium]
MDEEIARRIRRGDEKAFDAFFDRFGGPLLGYLTGMVGNRASAEDLLQETVIRIHRNIDRYKERGAFRSWVYRIATNGALSELRRARFAAESLDGSALQVPDPGAANPLDLLEAEERERALRKGMETLPDDHRAVLLLRVREGMPVAEIARTLRIPLGTVKSRMHYGVRKLRAYLEEEDRPAAGVPDGVNEDEL